MNSLLLPNWKRAVVKVGSALIAPDGKGCKTRHLLPIARFIAEAREAGREVVLVSSGAVAAGLGMLPEGKGLTRGSIPEKQALAAIGQSQLMAIWSRLFDVPCAQVLLTHADLHNRKRFVNARNTIKELLRLDTLPIVNENDTVAVDEIKVGDNDNLAAHVAALADADLLLILSDIDGLYDANPHHNPDATRIAEVHVIDDSIRTLAGGSHNAIATGGMVTKIQAAEKATARGIDTIIAAGADSRTFAALSRGYNPGTIFHKTRDPITARKHWLSHALPVCGQILVDPGAASALLERGASLLPSGVLQVEGNFLRGDAIEIKTEVDGEIKIIARGLSQYNNDQLGRIKGLRSSEIAAELGYSHNDVVVHRGDMAMAETNLNLDKNKQGQVNPDGGCHASSTN